MDKQNLRQTTIQKVKELTTKEKQQIEESLINQLVSSTLWQQANTIGVTMSQGFEWDTKAIIERAWEQDKTVCVPKCEPQQKKLTFYQLDTYDQLEVVYYKLLEPKPDPKKQMDKKAIDLLIVPGILFDQQGYRIGFGGGYYDRFLIDFPNQTVSLVSAIQLVDKVPSESFDIPVQHLITNM
ncbi:5-formyltetrahydrofolate cyclo-ligase [Virgibacillus halotolerans]|uniref:5-formyltetrahydrofolate cyclo-ligase n=1 Tax=Virgibacillus halotolerans TaxID=1071053 RepID=UPI00195FBD21|nr:5-formyltetrahydrofolate cyclo-ligase [Virgibacillus halotolerans]MBM7597960.1 5-formyltetrahydrofolate cyclo-ligase [Virgibacillus halotolerans]